MVVVTAAVVVDVVECTWRKQQQQFCTSLALFHHEVVVYHYCAQWKDPAPALKQEVCLQLSIQTVLLLFMLSLLSVILPVFCG